MKASAWRIAVAAGSIGVFVFLLAPSLVVIPISFGNPDAIVFPPTVWSTQLFRRFFSDPSWLDALWLSVRVALAATALAVLLGVPTAYALARSDFPGKRLVNLFLLGPLMVPHVVIALALYIFFIRTGIRQGLLRLILGHVVLVLPYILISASVGLRGIDPAIERAATIMGARPLRVFWSVTVPLLRPSILSGALLSILISLDEVVVAWFVSRAGYTTLPVKMFTSIQWDVSPILATISTLLTLLSLVVCLAVAAIQPREEAQ